MRYNSWGWGGGRAGTTGPIPIKGKRKCIRRPVNWEKVKEVTQEKEQNPALKPTNS